MASGYSSSFAKETDSKKNNPANLVLLFVVSVFLTYNAGYYTTNVFHHEALSKAMADGDFSGQVASGPLKACNNRIKAAQVGFFTTHSCWFNISRRPDWVATRLFFQARALASKKNSGPGGDDKCGFVSIGTGTYDPSPQLLAAYRNDPEAGVKMNVDDYVLNMKASSAFDQCYTFTYTTERSLPMVQQALAGVRQALVRPLWSDADTTLDTEFAKITSSLVEGTIFVKSHLRAFESDLLAGFKTGLASGRVGAIVWEREVFASQHVRSLKDEVDFVSSFGYAVYLASAEEAEMNTDFQRVYTPSVYIRLDRGLWDGAYSVDNANLVLTIVAVQQSHPLRAYLDSQQALCPIKQSRSGPTCDCMLENFPTAEDGCHLVTLVGERPFFVNERGDRTGKENNWRQPLGNVRGLNTNEGK